jgi:hypothetical protein
MDPMNIFVARMCRSRSWACLLLAATWCVALSQGQPADPDRRWDGFRFLAGEWVGEGSGSPGEGSGAFTFAFELDKNILQRTSAASYPATKDRPPFTHEDLMVVYFERNVARALYCDNEQHVIHYGVFCSADSVVFLSDRIPSAPRFRLTYAKTGTDRVAIAFEMAPPGNPEAFSPYLQGSARRKP